MNRLYGSEQQVASVKPKPGWQHAPWQDYPADDDIPSVQKVARYNTRQYLQGGRVGKKPGGLVEPGVTRYGQDGRGLHARDMLTKKEQELIEKAFPDMKFDFSPTQTYGVKKYLTKGKTNKEWTKIYRFITKGFKKEKGEGLTARGEEYKTRGERLSVADQNKIIARYDLPEGIKEWDFVNNKYGIEQTGRRNLVRRMAATVADKRKWTLAADFGSTKGWMLAQMERVYKNETEKMPDGTRKAKKGIKLTYEPVFDIFDDGSKKGRRIIVGFKDNTKAGNRKTFYGLKKWSKKNAANWTKHGDWKLNQKLVDISKRSLNEPNKVIMGLLEKKGFTGKIKLNDLIHYLSGVEGTSRERIKNAVIRHHQSGVAFGSATGDLALTTQTINSKIMAIEKRIRANKILPDDIQTLKNNNVYVRHEGRLYGSGSKTAIGQFKQIEKSVEAALRSKEIAPGWKKKFDAEEFKKFITNNLDDFCTQKVALGGRIGFAGTCTPEQILENMKKDQQLLIEYKNTGKGINLSLIHISEPTRPY